MKLRILLLAILFSTSTFCQSLPKNSATGLVSIMDSIPISEKTVDGMQAIVRQWQKVVNDRAQLQKIFNFKTGVESASFHCSPGFQWGKDKFTDKGSFLYTGNKVVLGQHLTDISNGKVDFSLNYEIRDEYIVLEFTDFNFTWRYDEQVIGRFEDAKTSKPFAVGVTANNKKNWERIKVEYLDRFFILMTHLKTYYDNFSKPSTTSVRTLRPSGVTYQNYEQIKKDMIYEQVRVIIGEDGKEESNLTQTMLNKEITTRIVRWINSEDHGKVIIATFRNGKLVIKQQQNL